ncbi:MAG TPA: family 16 glycoside hydrolase [Gemmataceae bacterium]|nr:family 16 glycoside hydrolase [Gemmataceae bacterium]
MKCSASHSLAAFLTCTLLAASGVRSQEIQVDASKVFGRVSRHLTGACIEDVNHEIYGGLYSQMVFGESFQEPVPPPTIIGFTSFGGSWHVKDGIVHIQATDGPKLVSDHAAFSDGAIGVEVQFVDRKTGNAGLIVRVDEAGVGADRFTGYEIALNPARQRVLLARHRNNFEPIHEVECEVAVGRWIPLEVRLSGSVVDILVDGTSILRHDDGKRALSAGKVALRAWQREARYRNLWVKTGPNAKTLPFESTQPKAEVSAMWRPVQRGTATGRYALVSSRPFTGSQSQQVTFLAGDGEWGIENQGLNRWGMNFVQGRGYEGYIWAWAENPANLVAALESRDGSRRYGETTLNVTGKDWQRLDFSLTPNASDSAGRFTLKLREPGSIVLGHAFLQPGEWGRFKGLPVRRDVVEALIAQGITVLRYGGSMINHPEYRWKKMIGPRDRRPPYQGTWYPYSSNGWGILDFLNVCEAAGFLAIPAVNMDETAQDLADFIEYVNGPATSKWGSRRAADGHPAPYQLRYLELGNEERVDEDYFKKFQALAEAIWVRDSQIILVVGDWGYREPIRDPFHCRNFSGITTLAAHRDILRLARKHGREIWFDIHVSTEGPRPDFGGTFSFIDALQKLADGAKHGVVIFEFNAGNHSLRRALANAAAINRVERDGRIPIATSANCLQPDKQNDNGWNQGLLFLDPAQVWLQPPGYVTQMYSRNYLPNLVQCQVTGANDRLDVSAQRSDDGRAIVLNVVNPTDKAIATPIHLAGFVPKESVAQVTELSGTLDGRNTGTHPRAIVPQSRSWKHALTNGNTRYTFPPYSITVLRWE